MLSTERAPRAEDEWRRVTVHGTWDDQHTIVLKYQTRDQGAGVDVVTPLVTESGAAVLVDRGWMPTENTGAQPARAPAGHRRTGHGHRVGTTGRDRERHEGQRPVDPGDLLAHDRRGARRTRSTAASSTSPRRARHPAEQLEPTELPDDTSNGPHFFYGLQWWFFGALAIFGFCYLAWDEFRQRRQRRGGRSERPQHAAVHGQHHAGDEG